MMFVGIAVLFHLAGTRSVLCRTYQDKQKRRALHLAGTVHLLRRCRDLSQPNISCTFSYVEELSDFPMCMFGAVRLQREREMFVIIEHIKLKAFEEVSKMPCGEVNGEALLMKGSIAGFIST